VSRSRSATSVITRWCRERRRGDQLPASS
jgi:hypothetical protein